MTKDEAKYFYHVFGKLLYVGHDYAEPDTAVKLIRTGGFDVPVEYYFLFGEIDSGSKKMVHYSEIPVSDVVIT